MSAADRDRGACGADGGHCITCSDEALPMRVIEVDPTGLATCLSRDGELRAVEAALLPGVAPGDEVLVHADVAIAYAAERAPA